MAAKQPAPLKKFVKYHADGSLWAKGTTRGGKLDGHFVWYWKDGKRMGAGTFTRGKRTGRWTRYDKKGKATKVTNFG